LRFACTGQEPPNAARGKNFIHDNQLSGTAIVKAKIMLAFVTAHGWNVTITKVMQVTKEKTRSTFKLIDSSISIEDETGQV